MKIAGVKGFVDSWLDIFSWAGIGLCLVGMVFLFYASAKDVKEGRRSVFTYESSRKKEKIHRPKEIEDLLKQAQQALSDKEYGKVIMFSNHIIKKLPQESLAYLYLGRAFYKKGQLAKSIINYRLAVELNPELVDVKNPDKINSSLSAIVKETLEKKGAGKFGKSKDAKQAIKDAYYLLRRLAGGCE